MNIYISHIREFCALAIVLSDWNGFYHILTSEDVDRGLDRARGGASAEELTRCQELSDTVLYEAKPATEVFIFSLDRDVK